MLRIPTIATSVTVIGGPTGPAMGALGPTGLRGAAVTGATGIVGPTGLRGMTGPVGLAGLIGAFVGATGRKGPPGSDGYPGFIGPTGSSDFVPPERFRYYENLVGYKNFSPGGNAVGCKFFYTPQKIKCIVVVFFTALVEPTLGKQIRVGISNGTGTAPNSGAPGFGGNTLVVASGLSIPVFFMLTQLVGYAYETTFSPQYWYDLSAATGTSSFDPASGGVRNINCVIMEF